MSLFQNILLWCTMFVPSITVAATVHRPENFKGVIDLFINIIETLTLLIFALTIVTLMWGIVKNWIIHGGEAESIESGKKIVVAGIVALVIMVSIWGILAILQKSLFGA